MNLARFGECPAAILCCVPVMLIASFLPAATVSDLPDGRLLEAAKAGDQGSIRILLKEHVDANIPEADGTTALHWAVRHDDIGSATLLIGGGANLNSANRYGVTPLSVAALNGSAPMVEALLSAGASPNAILPGGETALMTAARSGNINAVRALLSHGADVNAKEDRRGQTALMWAADEGHATVVETLLKAGADPDVRSKAGFSPLLFAARDGRLEVVRDLLKAGVDVNEELPKSNKFAYENALVLAVGNGHYELAEFLLDAGAKENSAALGWTILHEITWVRKPGSGANPLPPAGSGKMDSLEFVRAAVRRGTDVNARVTKKPSDLGTTNLKVIGATPLLMAARTADAPLMRLLKELGADPKLTTAEHTTLLMVAAGVGTQQFGEDPGTEDEVLEAVKVALELGGDVNAMDDNGETVIHGAAYKEVPSVAQFLIDQGAKIQIWNQKNKLGWTPLRISEGVTRGQNVRHRSPATAAVIRHALSEAGLSTDVEPEKKRE
jgi:uncharacterized protein